MCRAIDCLIRAGNLVHFSMEISQNFSWWQLPLHSSTKWTQIWTRKMYMLTEHNDKSSIATPYPVRAEYCNVLVANFWPSSCPDPIIEHCPHNQQSTMLCVWVCVCVCVCVCGCVCVGGCVCGCVWVWVWGCVWCVGVCVFMGFGLEMWSFLFFYTILLPQNSYCSMLLVYSVEINFCSFSIHRRRGRVASCVDEMEFSTHTPQKSISFARRILKRPAPAFGEIWKAKDSGHDQERKWRHLWATAATWKHFHFTKFRGENGARNTNRKSALISITGRREWGGGKEGGRKEDFYPERLWQFDRVQ